MTSQIYPCTAKTRPQDLRKSCVLRVYTSLQVSCGGTFKGRNQNFFCRSLVTMIGEKLISLFLKSLFKFRETIAIVVVPVVIFIFFLKTQHTLKSPPCHLFSQQNHFLINLSLNWFYWYEEERLDLSVFTQNI